MVRRCGVMVEYSSDSMCQQRWQRWRNPYATCRSLRLLSTTSQPPMYILQHESEKKTFSNMKTLLTKLGVVHQKIKFTSLCQELYTLHIAPAPIFYSPFVEFQTREFSNVISKSKCKNGIEAVFIICSLNQKHGQRYIRQLSAFAKVAG